MSIDVRKSPIGENFSGVKRMEDTKVKEKLLKLRVAFYELSEAWDQYRDDEGISDGFLCEGYPFSESFDETTAKVSDWVETHAGFNGVEQ